MRIGDWVTVCWRRAQFEWERKTCVVVQGRILKESWLSRK